MLRLLFEKTGRAVWISHLDLMRLFQRAFKRADLPLTHTQGFNPRPSVSIAMPLSVGVESKCELLDFELDGVCPGTDEICTRLNEKLVEGVRVLKVYAQGEKIKNLAYLQCTLQLVYDTAVPDDAVCAIENLFAAPELLVVKKTKNGPVEQNIIPLIKSAKIARADAQTVTVDAMICCQNPSLNPMQMVAAIQRHIPDCAPNEIKCIRQEIYSINNEVFR